MYLSLLTNVEMPTFVAYIKTRRKFHTPKTDIPNIFLSSSRAIRELKHIFMNMLSRAIDTLCV